MGPDELQIVPEHILHRVDHAALDAGDVREQRAALQTVLVIPDPLEEDVGVEGKDHQIEAPDIVLVHLPAAVADPALVQREVDGLFPPGHRPHLIALIGEGLGVGAADEAQPHDEYFRILVNLHILPPVPIL